MILVVFSGIGCLQRLHLCDFALLLGEFVAAAEEEQLRQNGLSPSPTMNFPPLLLKSFLQR